VICHRQHPERSLRKERNMVQALSDLGFGCGKTVQLGVRSESNNGMRTISCFQSIISQ
jgi:hypothetical protein